MNNAQHAGSDQTNSQEARKAARDAKVAELSKIHGPVKVFTLNDGREFYFKRATAADYRRFKAAMMGMGVGRMEDAAMAGEMAARALCVFPSPSEFDRLRDESPAVAGSIGEQLVYEVGGRLEVVQGEP